MTTSTHTEGEKSTAIPLCVDLDGTLIRSDSLWESMMKVMKENPFVLFLMPLWLIRGKAHFKQKLCLRAVADASLLPYQKDLLDFLRDEHARGRRLILATASDETMAKAVAEYLGIFDAVIASDGTANMEGPTKAMRLTELYGKQGFDYAGNSRADHPVWKEARHAIAVNTSRSVRNALASARTIDRSFGEKGGTLQSIIQTVRPHQWLKNLLIFVPLLMNHQLTNIALLSNAFIAFCSFSVTASAIYAVNDLLDIESDRRHPRKRRRPLAAGNVPVSVIILLVPFLLGIGGCLALALPSSFHAVLLAYLFLATAYSLRLKSIFLIDILILSSLYMLRIIAGGTATEIPVSFWLLAFSGFIFLSLALVKRCTELHAVTEAGETQTTGRNYHTKFEPALRFAGRAAGGAAAITLALYINSMKASELYERSWLLWPICLVLLWWTEHVWKEVRAGRMKDDPLIFTMRDPMTYAIALLILLLMYFASA